MENKKKQVKILVCCGIKGHITSFIDHIESLFAKKGMFDYVFCVGDFFGDDVSSEKEWEEFKKSGKYIPIYTLGPNKIQHEKYFNNLKDQQLAPNIYYLGKDGIFTTSDGLKIGYISGIQNNSSKENEIHTFNYDSLSQFRDSCIRAGSTSLDVLLTSPWPVDIRNKERILENISVKEPTEKESESQLLSWVAIHLTPRYHFAGLQQVFYQRSPYKNTNSKTVTRFIGLGDYHDNKTKKQKWLYGFVLSPAELTTPNTNDFTVTESPYADNISQYTANMLPVSKQYFYNTSTNTNYKNNNQNKKRKFDGQPVRQSIDISADSCWFCLSSKNITKHLIISIGNQVYLSGTKGPLVKEHILVAPIEHYKSLAEVPPETENEINLIKSSLNQYFESTGRVAVYFERNILSAHFQLQVVPVPIRKADHLEDMFKAKFKEYDLSLVDIPPAASLRQIAGNTEGHYFCTELPNGKRLFHSAAKKIGHSQKFPIHIAREVLASPRLLNVESRIDWRKCEQSLDEEENDVKMFRDAFEPFNPIKD
ncbi:PREDICTED: CWF19-like protein 1 isoform X2 [Diuraphis noxia]|uniref:CWF19-like protein 1 isoform X2 n=1 Tax=Diuraphis noxia TaxID=143948 RepID=UPI000763915F|nr:PREDICTED: CWF19-like protein 1 isoform X2 [Diuraphis noxia]